MCKFALINLFLIIVLSTYAKETITGIVLDKISKEVVPGANILIKDENDKYLKYTSTDIDGRFSLTIDSLPSISFLQINSMGYKRTTIPLNEKESFYKIYLETGSLQLQEIIVKAKNITGRGDTITYNVGSFAHQQDKTIGDVLKRMPGIDVSADGRIKYQGSDINKFYIEGADLLEGKYAIATEGINRDDVGAVEVLENHQPMQVLQGLSFSDRAAINLKMKEKSKASWLFNGNLSGGWSQYPKGLLWIGELFTMMLNGDYQMITTLKTNNNGNIISDQLNDFTSVETDEKIKGYLSFSYPSTPNLERKRSYFNRMWMVSTSHLIKTSNKGEFKTQIDFINNRVSADAIKNTTYFIENGNKMINEDDHSLDRMNNLDMKFIYEINDKTLYLKNILSFDFSWNSLSLSTNGTIPNLQNIKLTNYNISNTIKVIKRFKNNKLVTFSSLNEWNSLPESLNVSYLSSLYGQKISQSSFYTDENASLGFIFKPFIISLDGGISGFLRNLKTDLWGLEIEDINNVGNITTNYIRIYLSPKIEYNYNNLSFIFQLPLNFYSYFFSKGIINRTELFVSPSITCNWKITSKMNVALRGNIRRSPADLHNIHDSSILTNYRSFNEGIGNYYSSKGNSVSASYSFRNPSAGLFISVNGNYLWNRSKFGMAQYLVDNYIFHYYSEKPSSSNSTIYSLNASKFFNFLRGSIGIKSTYLKTNNQILSQEVPTRFKNESISLTPFVNGVISQYLTWDIKFFWNSSSLMLSDLSKLNSNNFIYSANISVFPCKLFNISTGGEFYRNQLDDRKYKNMLMLDTKITFNISKRIELSASLTNILNHRQYSYVNYGPVSETENVRFLRGREFLISIYLKK